MTWLLRLFCSHRTTYRERRPLHGVKVLHWVCEHCGFAEPVVQRTAKEHRQAIKVGTPRLGRAVGQGKVIAIKERAR